MVKKNMFELHRSEIENIKIKAKQEELVIIESLIELHKDCHKYHKIDGKDATCLDIVLKHIKDEISHLSTFENKRDIIADKSNRQNP